MFLIFQFLVPMTTDNKMVKRNIFLFCFRLSDQNMTGRLERSRSELRNASSLNLDPYGQLTRRKRFDEELDSIRARSRSIWLRPDNSLTTHGHFFTDPEQIERTLLRPTSASRRHNPHPKL
jgi:hypothetical protein